MIYKTIENLREHLRNTQFGYQHEALSKSEELRAEALQSSLNWLRDNPWVVNLRSGECCFAIARNSCSRSWSQHGLNITIFGRNFVFLTNVNGSEPGAYVPHLIFVTASEFTIERTVGFPFHSRCATKHQRPSTFVPLIQLCWSLLK